MGHVDYVSQVRVFGLEGTLAASRAGLSCLFLLSPVSLLSVHKNLPFFLAQQPRRLLQNLLPVDHRVIPDLLLPHRRQKLTALRLDHRLHLLAVLEAREEHLLLVSFFALVAVLILDDFDPTLDNQTLDVAGYALVRQLQCFVVRDSKTAILEHV